MRLWILLLLGVQLISCQITNGDFEVGVSSPATLPAGNTQLTGWSILSTITVTNSPTPISGTWFVDLRGSGSIEQTVATTTGQRYMVTFQYSSSDNINTRTLTVNAASSSEVHLFRKTAAVDWNQGFLIFTAAADSTAIRFTASGSVGSGIFLDDIQLWPLYDTVAPSLTNPSFESESCASASCTDVTALTGWGVTSGAVEVSTTKWDAYDGSISIGMVQSATGTTLTKQFTVTNPKRLHFATWRMSVDPSLVNGVATMTVGQPAIGSDQRTYGRPFASGPLVSQMGYMSMVFPFIPNSTTITLRIQASQVLGTGKGAVIDDFQVHVAAMMELSPASFDEGSNGNNDVTITGQIPFALSEGFAVKWQTADGETDSSDLTPASPTVTVAGGQTSNTFTLSVSGDDYVEDDEDFVMYATEVYGNKIKGAVRLDVPFSIVNDDVPIIGEITASTFNVTEGDSTGSSVTVTINMENLSEFTTTVGYTTVSRTADEGTDYVGVTANCDIPAGSNTCDVTIQITPDTIFEDDETFVFQVRRVNGVALDTPVEATITILNDDVVEIASVTAVSWAVPEGDVGPIPTTSVPITITTTITGQAAITVGFSSVSGTADFSDFDGSDRFCVIPAGQFSCVAEALIVPDDLHEIDETFVFSIRRINGETLDTFVDNTITILNDDAPPVFSIPTTLTIQENVLSGDVNIPMSISMETGVVTTLNFYTTDGTALDQDDYNATTGSIVWATLSTFPRFIFVPIINDEKQELSRYFTVTIMAAAGSEDHVTLGNSVCNITILPDNICYLAPGEPSCEPDDSTPAITISFPQNNTYPVGVFVESIPREDTSLLTRLAYDVTMLNYFFRLDAFLDGNLLPTFSFNSRNPLTVTIDLDDTEIRLTKELALFMIGDSDEVWADGTTTCGKPPVLNENENTITFYVCHLTTFALVTMVREQRDPILEWSMRFTCGDSAHFLEGFFTEITGLKNANEWECERYTHVNGRETTNCLPSQFVVSPVVVKRILTLNDEIWDWRDIVTNGRLTESRQNCTLVLFDREYVTARQYTLINAWPAAVALETSVQTMCGPVDALLRASPNCKGKRALMETVTIIHEGLTEGGEPVAFSILDP